MKDSISVVVKGQSSSGKSHLVNTILRLFPRPEIFSFTYVTSKALVHRKGSLSHKILYIAEHSGSQGADYSIRALLSEGEISIMLPVKNEATGNFETVEKRIKATGLVFCETTTRDRVNHENQTRVFDLYVDESEAQTENILFMQAAQIDIEDKGIDEEVRIWRAAQTHLKNYSVHIPYALELAKAFPKDKTRARRDFPRLLSLIRAHTLLYQFDRPRDKDGRLVATFEDFRAILPLAETVLRQSLKEISPKQEATLKIIKTEFLRREFSLKDLAEKTASAVTYRTLQRYLEHFVKEGLIEWNGEKAKQSRYTVSMSMTLCHKGVLFTPNFLESLKKKYDNPHLSSIIANDANELIEAVYDNSRQNGMRSINANQDKGLG